MSRTSLPKLTTQTINSILKSRDLENLELIRMIEDFLKKNRGYVFKMPKPNTPVMLLFSGGLDTTIVAAILMEEYGLKIYPVFTRRGHPYQQAEEKAADFFTRYFQDRYPGQFSDLLKIETSFPPMEIRWAYEKVENKPMKQGSKQTWGDFFYSNLICTYGAQCAYYFQITQNLPIRTIFTAYMKSDGEYKIDMTLTTIRGTMLSICLVTHDFDWQITSLPLEKELGFFYDKEYFIKWATKNGIPLEMTRSSCRSKTDYHCGNCLFCNFRKDVFRKAGVPDKTIYTNTINQSLLRKIGKAMIPYTKLRKMLKKSLRMS